MKVDVAIIGGGPAGLAAAVKAADEGASVIILERAPELGGILPQCIHQGFGLFVFDEMLTGPEYAQHFIDEVGRRDSIEVKLDTMVLEIDKDRSVVASNLKDGVFGVEAGSVVLAMGCRERTRNQILIPGDRPAGIYTAGTTQRLINVEGIMPGSRVVILGSGDVGLIMARRFMLEGAQVEGVYEIMSHQGGLTRNVVQCLEDFDIPLHLGHTVTEIHGRDRVEGVTVAEVDGDWRPIEGSKRYVECDTFVLAVGLIPENELSRSLGVVLDAITGGPIVDEHMMTSVPGVFSSGNVVHVHDIVDDVTTASYIAGVSAARFAKGEKMVRGRRSIVPGEGVSYVVPQLVSKVVADEGVTLYFRVGSVMKDVVVRVGCGDTVLFEKKERKVIPPEMIKVVLPKEKLESSRGQILVEVKAR